jgi:hypothetical protein
MAMEDLNDEFIEIFKVFIHCLVKCVGSRRIGPVVCSAMALSICMLDRSGFVCVVVGWNHSSWGNWPCGFEAPKKSRALI